MSFCMRWAQGAGASVMIAATEAMTVESDKSGRASTNEKDTHVTKFDDGNRSDDDGQGEETKVIHSQTPMEKKIPGMITLS